MGKAKRFINLLEESICHYIWLLPKGWNTLQEIRGLCSLNLSLKSVMRRNSWFCKQPLNISIPLVTRSQISYQFYNDWTNFQWNRDHRINPEFAIQSLYFSFLSLDILIKYCIRVFKKSFYKLSEWILISRKAKKL